MATETDDEVRDGDSDDEGALEAELVDAAPPSARLPSRLVSRASRGSATPLARYDPLEAYMRDVQRYRLLTAEEEHEAAVRYHEHEDLEAAAQLVTANLRLVVKIAYDYRRAHKNLPDLIQEGNIGLMQAVKKFDPYKGVKLSTYAAWWIRAYILRFILNNARLVKLGTTQAQRKLFFNLQKEKSKLKAMGIEPAPETIAERLNVSTDDVVQMDRRLSAGDVSLDAPVGGSEEPGPSRVDLLPGRSTRVDDMLADEEIHQLVRERLDAFGETLSGKDARIFHDRMMSDQPMTLQELGDTFGISRERVRQLEKRLHERLRTYLSAELGDAVVE